MSYQLSYRKAPDYLHIEAAGIRTVENFIAISTELLTKTEEHGYKKVLLDMRGVTGGLRIVDLYKVETKHLSQLWRTTGRPQVVVIDWEDNRKRFEFMETVAVNNGVNTRMFTDVDEATEWLEVSS